MVDVFRIVKSFMIGFVSYVRIILSSVAMKAMEKPKNFFLYTIIIFAVFFVLFSSYGLVTRIRLEVESETYRKKIEKLEIHSMKIDSLVQITTCLDEIERVAREDYNFSLHGELIYSIEDE